MNIDADAIRSDLLAAKGEVDAALTALAGFSRQPWIKRAGAAHCNHVDPITGIEYFHINRGWDFSKQAVLPGHWRTKDFVTVERAQEPTGLLADVFCEMASFDGKLYSAGGLWDYPPSPNNDHCTDKIFLSDTGGFWGLDSGAPPVHRECHALLASGGYLKMWGGERYSVPTDVPPVYVMPTDGWRKPIGGGPWEQCSSAVPQNRSFAYFGRPDGDWMIGGRGDLTYPAIVDRNDIWVATDNGLGFQHVGIAPFRGAFGRRATPAFGGHIITGGAYGLNGSGNTADTVHLNEAWFLPGGADPTVAGSWIAMPPLPIAVVHHMAGALTINGVETFALIGGYNSKDRPDGSPYGTIFTTTDPSVPMVARPESDFSVG